MSYLKTIFVKYKAVAVTAASEVFWIEYQSDKHKLASIKRETLYV